MTDQPGVDSANQPVYPLDRMWEPLGHEHWLKRHTWTIDGQAFPVEVGFALLHKNSATGRWCMSGVHYDIPEVDDRIEADQRWQLLSLNPLHVEPSIKCLAPSGPGGAECGDHGHVRAGRWEPA